MNIEGPMYKTSWQEHFWQISGALVAALCQDPALKLIQVHIKNNNNYKNVLCSSYLPRPKPGGDQRSMGIDYVCVHACVCLECQCFTIIAYIYCDIWCIFCSRPYGDVSAAFWVTLRSVTLYVVMTAHAY